MSIFGDAAYFVGIGAGKVPGGEQMTLTVTSLALYGVYTLVSCGR